MKTPNYRSTCDHHLNDPAPLTAAAGAPISDPARTNARPTSRAGGRRSGRLAAIALLALTHAASAATVLWTGAGDGVAWNQAANWSNNVLPTASSDVAISGMGAKVTITR